MEFQILVEIPNSIPSWFGITGIGIPWNSSSMELASLGRRYIWGGNFRYFQILLGHEEVSEVITFAMIRVQKAVLDL